MFVRKAKRHFYVDLKHLTNKMFHNSPVYNIVEMNLKTKNILEKIFLSSVSAVQPQKLMKNAIKLECNRLIIGHKWYPLNKNVHLVGFGKAVLGMAAATEKILGHHLVSGILCVPTNTINTFMCNPEFALKEKSVIKIYEGASNNLPDEDALEGAKAIVEKIKSIAVSDILIVLISGGGSALLPLPRNGLTLEDKVYTIKLLSCKGASIKELNTVRKKLSELKGGGLALLSYPKTTITLILSDVVNDPLDIIASGPTIPNSDDPLAAYQILKKYDLMADLPERIIQVAKEDSSKPCIPTSSKGYLHVDNFIIGNNNSAIHQAKLCAEECGLRTIILSKSIDSPVNNICDFYVNLSLQVCKALTTNELNDFVNKINEMLRTCQYDFPPSLASYILDCMKLQEHLKGICFVAGGETTIEVKGSGIGGRNQELALLISQKLFKLKQAHPTYFKNFDITFLSAGTDGIDGNSYAAGAVGCSDIINRALDNYIDPAPYLTDNNSNGFFNIADKGSHLITTGHTGTNVMDLHVLLIRNVCALGTC